MRRPTGASRGPPPSEATRSAWTFRTWKIMLVDFRIVFRHAKHLLRSTGVASRARRWRRTACQSGVDAEGTADVRQPETARTRQTTYRIMRGQRKRAADRSMRPAQNDPRKDGTFGPRSSFYLSSAPTSLPQPATPDPRGAQTRPSIRPVRKIRCGQAESPLRTSGRDGLRATSGTNRYRSGSSPTSTHCTASRDA